jgi:hypothetical protein
MGPRAAAPNKTFDIFAVRASRQTSFFRKPRTAHSRAVRRSAASTPGVVDLFSWPPTTPPAFPQLLLPDLADLMADLYVASDTVATTTLVDGGDDGLTPEQRRMAKMQAGRAKSRAKTLRGCVGSNKQLAQLGHKLGTAAQNAALAEQYAGRLATTAVLECGSTEWTPPPQWKAQPLKEKQVARRPMAQAACVLSQCSARVQSVSHGWHYALRRSRSESRKWKRRPPRQPRMP